MKLEGFLKKKKVGSEQAAEAPVPAAEGKSSGIDLNRIVEEFKTLDPKDPGLWPTAPRALILSFLLAGLVAAAWFFDWTPRLEELENKRATEARLKEEWLEKKKQAVNLDAYRAQLAEIDASFGVLLEQLPNESEIGALLVDVNKAAQANGLAIERFKPGAEKRQEFYAEIPIEIELIGGYHDLAQFASDVSQLPRIITLNNIDLAPKGKGEMIGFKAQAKTFRYLDEAELAAQRKAAKGGKGGKSAKGGSK